MSYQINPIIVRKYDIRGVFKQDFFLKDAYLFGLGYANFLIKHFDNKYNKQVVVGRDGRISSYEIQQQVIKGLSDGGIDVLDIGLATTPMVDFADEFIANSIGSMQVSASHNPKEYNGLKLNFKHVELFGDKLQELYNYTKNSNISKQKGRIISNEEQQKNIKNKYIEYLFKNITFGNKQQLKVLFDCGNGVSGFVINEFMEQLQKHGITSNVIFDTVDGNFPNHHPDPVEEENMQILSKKVIEGKYSLGIGFDGDGDRLGVVDGKGRFVKIDHLMCLFAKDIINKNSGCNIVITLLSSKVLYDYILKFGGNPILSAVGYGSIKSLIEKYNAKFAGETSGHLMFPDITNGNDDGIYSAVRLLEILSNQEEKLETFIDKLPKTFSYTKKIKVEEEKKFNIIEKVALQMQKDDKQYINIDGVLYQQKNYSWVIRASNTTNNVMMVCESSDNETLKIAINEAENYLNNSIKNV